MQTATLILVLIPIYILKAIACYYALRWIIKWRRKRYETKKGVPDLKIP